jgi:purine-nucleoside phosphorylase
MSYNDTAFIRLFGVEKDAIAKTVVLIPFLSARILSQCGVEHSRRGCLYRTYLCRDFTLIHTGIGQGFAGDCVLNLKGSPCRNLFIFGSCGAVRKISGCDIGSVVTVRKVYAFDSFTQMLEGARKKDTYQAAPSLLKPLLASCPRPKPVVCASVASLALEGKYRDSFIRHGIDVLDMETAALFAAARACGFDAASVLYVSDIVGSKPFYAPRTARDKKALDKGRTVAFELLCTLIRKNQ